MDAARIAAWLRRVPKGAERVVLKELESVVGEVDLNNPDAAQEIAAAMVDIAGALGRPMSLTLWAVKAGPEKDLVLARIQCRARPTLEEVDTSAADSRELVRVLTAHTHALMVTQVEQTRVITAVWKDLLGVLSSRLVEAEESRSKATALLDEAIAIADNASRGKSGRQGLGQAVEGLIEKAAAGAVDGFLKNINGKVPGAAGAAGGSPAGEVAGEVLSGGGNGTG